MTMPSLVSAQRNAIDALCRRFHVRRLDLFGSSAKGTATSDSDFDFLVEFDSFTDGGYADAYFGLLDGLQALLDAPVDLVVLPAIRNPYFRQSVEHSRSLLYAA